MDASTHKLLLNAATAKMVLESIRETQQMMECAMNENAKLTAQHDADVSEQNIRVSDNHVKVIDISVPKESME